MTSGDIEFHAHFADRVHGCTRQTVLLIFPRTRFTDNGLNKYVRTWTAAPMPWYFGRWQSTAVLPVWTFVLSAIGNERVSRLLESIAYDAYFALFPRTLHKPAVAIFPETVFVWPNLYRVVANVCVSKRPYFARSKRTEKAHIREASVSKITSLYIYKRKKSVHRINTLVRIPL